MPRWYWDVSGSLKNFPFYSLFVSTRSLSFLRKCHLPPLDEIFTWPSISSHLTHNNLKTQKSWQNAMSFHMCMCVWKLKLCYLRFKWYSYQLEYANEWDELRKNENKFRMSLLSVHAKQNAIFVNERYSFWKMNHIIILNCISNTSVYWRIFIFAYLNVWAFKH